MPFTYRISPEERLAVVTASGQVDLRSVLEAMGRVAQDPRFVPGFRVFVDAYGMDYTPTLGQIRVLAWALGHERAAYQNKIAVLRPADAPGARADVYSRLAELSGVSLGLFSDRDAALAWIDGT